MFAQLFTTILKMLRQSMRMVNLELEVELTDHKIKTRAVNPEESDRAWDSRQWVHGNLYLEGLANPIKITPKDVKNLDEDYEIISSERYKTFMEQNLIDDMLNASKSDGLTIKQALIAIIASNVLTVGLIVVLTGGI